MAEGLPLTKACLVYDLGLVDYHQGLLLQEKLLNLRKSGTISDVLLLLQHPSVFTIGHSGIVENIIVSKHYALKVFQILKDPSPLQLINYNPFLTEIKSHIIFV